MNAMSCYICGTDGEVGVRALCREHQQRLPLLEADNARLQLRATAFERWFKAAVKHHNDLTVERDGYKALAERLSAFIEDYYKDGVCLNCSTNTTQPHDNCFVGFLEDIAAPPLLTNG